MKLRAGLLVVSVLTLLSCLVASGSTLAQAETRVRASTFSTAARGPVFGPSAAFLQLGNGQSYDGTASVPVLAAEADPLPLFVQGRGAEIATQSLEPDALAARDAVLRGARVFKGGNANSYAAEQSRFFALDDPATPGYAGRYGIPEDNLPFDWVASGRIRPGADFVTRPAPGVGSNLGGGIEVVTWPGSFVGG